MGSLSFGFTSSANAYAGACLRCLVPGLQEQECVGVKGSVGRKPLGALHIACLPEDQVLSQGTKGWHYKHCLVV